MNKLNQLGAWLYPAIREGTPSRSPIQPAIPAVDCGQSGSFPGSWRLRHRLPLMLLHQDNPGKRPTICPAGPARPAG